MSAELEQLREQYEQFKEKRRKAEAENPLQRVGELHEQLSALEATVKSPSGKVTVVAGPGGSIKDILLADDAVNQPASTLAAELKSTVQQAVAAAARQQATLVDEHMGGQLNVYDRVLENQADAFGTTVEELKRSLDQAPAKPAKPVRNEDDFSENTLLSKDYRKPPPPPSSSAGSGSAADQFLKNLFDEER
jgi:DNA-binding protein YbaB